MYAQEFSKDLWVILKMCTPVRNHLFLHMNAVHEGSRGIFVPWCSIFNIAVEAVPHRNHRSRLPTTIYVRYHNPQIDHGFTDGASYGASHGKIFSLSS